MASVSSGADSSDRRRLLPDSPTDVGCCSWLFRRRKEETRRSRPPTGPVFDPPVYGAFESSIPEPAPLPQARLAPAVPTLTGLAARETIRPSPPPIDGRRHAPDLPAMQLWDTTPAQVGDPTATTAPAGPLGPGQADALSPGASLPDLVVPRHGLVLTINGSDYALGRQIGAGSSGQVFEAVGPSGAVAVKIVTLDSAAHRDYDRLIREVEAQRACVHPHAVAFIEASSTVVEVADPRDPSASRVTGNFFIVMELVRGRELLTVLQGEHVPEDERLRWFAQITTAVQHLHAQGYVHRDLKLENVLIDSTTRRAKLVDFGFAKRTDTDDGLCSPCGTPMYAAPELYTARQRPYTPAVDIYSLGILLYVMICEEFPHMRSNGSRFPDGFPETLSALIRDMWSRNATLRPSFDVILTTIDGLLPRAAA